MKASKFPFSQHPNIRSKVLIMQLEDYFDFLAPNDIRITGHRIGIETVLYEYLFRARTPEEIAKIYNTLTLEEVYATILYYLHHKQDVDRYIQDWLEWGHQQRQAQAENPSPAIQRLRTLKAERAAQANAEVSGCRTHPARTSHSRYFHTQP